MRKICVVTGTRAEYGLLKPLLSKIKADNELQLQLVVTGMHLSPEFGLTYREIEEDGFIIDEKVEMLLSSDTSMGVAKAMGLATISFADSFNRLKPDIVVILGDRFEMLAVAQTALVMQIPIAHISGGEITKGAIDDSIRHALTKLSNLHFVANEEYRERVIQLGENPKYVWDVGDLGAENIKNIPVLNKNELEKYYGFEMNNIFLVTFHPPTLEIDNIKKYIDNLFMALDKFNDYKIIFTKSNADNLGRYINERIESYESIRENVSVYSSLGAVKYLSTLKYSRVVIGNSSSGIVEAPLFGIPTVNIGKRQEGRAQSNTIINTDYSSSGITNAIKKALDSKFDYIDLKYEDNNTSNRIIKILNEVSLSHLKIKEFYDR